MNKKQKIIVSVVGISIVLLTLLGLTYAYFLTRIQGNTNDKSISVTTANLELTYADGNGTITSNNIIPGTTLTDKEFTVTNNGNATVNNYAVYLEELVNELSRDTDMVYTLTCTSSKENGSCAGKSETTFPKLAGIIVTNSIDVGETQTYKLTVTYKEMNVDQSDDMGKKISARVQIYNLTDIVDVTGTVTNASAGDYVEMHSNPRKSMITSDNKYLIAAVEPGTHTLYVKDKQGTVKGSKEITIKKGNTASVSGTNITVTSDSQTINANITNISSTLTINIESVENYVNPNLLKNVIMTSAKTGGEGRTTMGTTVTEFTSISGDNDKLLNNAPDDYGTSYYYYGAVTDNYVSFADKLWRIVRINGDGTIRLILDDVAKDISGNIIKSAFNSVNDINNVNYDNSNNTKHNKVEFLSSKKIITNKFLGVPEKCYNDDDYGYVGYMYGSNTSYENNNDSTLKKQVDAWYKSNIVDTNNANYIADTLFCNDKSSADSSIGSKNPTKTLIYFAPEERLVYSTGTTFITTSKPTFKCAENAENDYSRFTVSVQTLLNGNKTNGNLKYPVGLLTADEVVYAGAYRYAETNRTYYLYNSDISSDWWLLSPGEPMVCNQQMFLFDHSEGSLRQQYYTNDNSFKPVLNLKTNVIVNDGDGTKGNPYTVKLS